jgi:hypothetical protein
MTAIHGSPRSPGGFIATTVSARAGWGVRLLTRENPTRVSDPQQFRGSDTLVGLPERPDPGALHVPRAAGVPL